MSVVPNSPSAFVPSPGTQAADIEPDQTEGAVVICGRCRLAFLQPRSAPISDSPRWSRCPPCQSRLLGDENGTNARWS